MDDLPDDTVAADRELVALVRRALALADAHEHWLAAAHLDRALVSLGEEPPPFELI